MMRLTVLLVVLALASRGQNGMEAQGDGETTHLRAPAAAPTGPETSTTLPPGAPTLAARPPCPPPLAVAPSALAAG